MGFPGEEVKPIIVKKRSRAGMCQRRPWLSLSKTTCEMNFGRGGKRAFHTNWSRTIHTAPIWMLSSVGGVSRDSKGPIDMLVAWIEELQGKNRSCLCNSVAMVCGKKKIKTLVAKKKKNPCFQCCVKWLYRAHSLWDHGVERCWPGHEETAEWTQLTIRYL